MDNHKLYDQVIRKAANDTSFKARLKADPKSAIKAEFGVMFPEGLSLSVVENTRTQQTLVLPALADELSESQLDQVSAGAGVIYHNPDFSIAAAVSPGGPGKLPVKKIDG